MSETDRGSVKAFDYDSPDSFNMSAEAKVFGPFTISGVPGGDKRLVMVEASEAAHIAYRDASTNGMVIRGNEKSDEREATVKGANVADAILVAACLVEVNTDGTPVSVDPNTKHPKTVSVDWVKGLPRRITSRLYAKVRMMSGMDEDQETEEFLTKRIETDTRKLARLRKDGPAGK